ncbi:unnamed protein product [Fraxinus pennsylvanica]|uniref:Uncharacterized protein n=1 Tax=Fraxinus pennsylvanica TaxID=56036 RepID=A0AAD1ZTI1_9LAMI|nr:unnamed protein product [Fraxinus pennsylvanica]
MQTQLKHKKRYEIIHGVENGGIAAEMRELDEDNSQQRESQIGNFFSSFIAKFSSSFQEKEKIGTEIGDRRPQMISTLGLSNFFHIVVLGSNCEHAKLFSDTYLKAFEILNVSKDNTFVFKV